MANQGASLGCVVNHQKEKIMEQSTCGLHECFIWKIEGWYLPHYLFKLIGKVLCLKESMTSEWVAEPLAGQVLLESALVPRTKFAIAVWKDYCDQSGKQNRRTKLLKGHPTMYWVWKVWGLWLPIRELGYWIGQFYEWSFQM